MKDNNSFWWSSGEGGVNPPVPPIDAIGQSLRFRGNSAALNMTCPVRSNGDRSWTWSGWIKLGARQSCSLFVPGTNTDVSGSVSNALYFGLNSRLWYQTLGTNQADAWRSDGLMSDIAAWYHIVFTVDVDNNQTNGYINGVRAGDTNVVNSTYMRFNETMGFRWGGTAYGDVSGDFYATDVYLIDGQVLLPTAFGRFNDNGVWVPREVDFTPAEMRWSDFLTVSNGTIDNGPLGATAAFNGDLSDGDGRCFTSTGADLTWAPPADNPATFTTTLEIFNTNTPTQQNISWNGNTVNPTGGWVTIFTDPSPDPDNPNVIDVNQPLVIDSIGAQRAELYAVRLDGEIVLNPYLWSAGVTLLGTGSEGGFDDPPENMFDGSTSTNCIGNQANQVISWVPPEPITYNQSVEIWTPSAPQTNIVFLFNEGTELLAVDNLENAWTTVTTGSGTFDNLRISGVNHDCRCAAVRIDGQIYIDGTNNSYGSNGFHLDFADPDDLGADRSGNANNFTATGFETANTSSPDYDVMADSPTQNYATYNPLGFNNGSLPSSITLNSANLGYTISSNPDIGFTIFTIPETGRYYFEAQPDNGEFIMRLYAPKEDNVAADFTGNLVNLFNTNTRWLASNSGTLAPNGQIAKTGPANTQVVIDANTQRIYMGDSTANNWLYNDGNGNYSIGAFDLTRPSIDYSGLEERARNNVQIAVCGVTGGSINFGQQPFFMPIPTGWDDTTVFQTMSMPAAPIADGSDHFQALTGTGPTTTITNATLVSSGNYTITNWMGSTGSGTPANDGYTANVSEPDPDAPGSSVLVSTASTINNNMLNFSGIGTGNAGGQGTMHSTRFVFDPPLTGPVEFQTSIFTGGNNSSMLINGIAQNTSAISSATEPYQTFNDDISNIVIFGASAQYNTWFTIQSVNGVESGGFVDNVIELTVADADGFNVGDYITNGLGNPGTITAVDGNVLTIQSPYWEAGWTAGGTIGEDLEILAYAQQTFPNGLWWIKSRVTDANTNHHQLVDTVRGDTLALWSDDDDAEQTYVAPAGNSVAWCWNAGGAAVANTDGTIASQVSANTDAGFSIISFTGDEQPNSSVGHGLNQAPDFVITKKLENDGNFNVFHVGAGETSYLVLNLTDTATDDSNMYNGTTDTVVNIGSYNAINADDEDMIMYAWTAIPGYSAFGSYTGNANGSSPDADGPFVSLNFRPAFLLIKRTDSDFGGEWSMHDTTRSPNNPNRLVIAADLANGEITQGGIDFLSNGFKIRDGSGWTNQSGGNYIYCAFAENPFNAPVTAR